MRKNWRGGGESLLKNGTTDGYAYQTCYSLAEFTLRGAPGTWGIFSTKTRKSPTIRTQSPGTVPYGKYGAGYFIMSIKSLDEGRR